MEENPIYKFMRENNLTQLDEQSFISKYSNPEEARKIHGFMVENNLTQLSDSDFYNKYLSQQTSQPIQQEVAVMEPPAPTQSQQPFNLTNAPASLSSIEKDTGAKDLANLWDSIDEHANISNQRMYGLPADLGETWAVGSAFLERKLGKIGLGNKEAKATDIWSYKLSQDYRKYLEDVFPVSQETRESFSGQIVDGIAQGITIMAASALTGGGSRAAGLIKAAESTTKLTPYVKALEEITGRFATTGGIIGGSQMAAPMYEEAIQSGATEQQALNYAIENFFVGSVMETLPVQSMFKRIAKLEPEARILDIFKQGSIGFGEEAVTEMMQETYANMSAQRIFDVNREMLDGVGEAGAVGGTVGFILNAALSALTGRRARVKTPQEKELLDKAIEETEAKIETVKTNNENISTLKEELENTEVKTYNDGATDYEFIKTPDGNLELTKEGLVQSEAESIAKGLSQKYPNRQFEIKDNTDPNNNDAEANWTVVSSPKKSIQEMESEITSLVPKQEDVKEEQEVVPQEEIQTPKISDQSGNEVTVRIAGENIFGTVQVDEGGKTTIETPQGRIYELDPDTPFTEYTRPVNVSQEGDIEVNGEPFTEARIVVEDGKPKALLIREDGTTKAITNPRVVEEIEYQIALANMESMTDQDADNLYNQYEQQRETETVTEEGAVEADERTEDDRKLQEALEEIDLIEQLALEELEQAETSAKLVEITPKGTKQPKVYLVNKNNDGTYSATLNGRKVKNQDVIGQLGQAYETETKNLTGRLQEQVNQLKAEVEQNLFGKPVKEETKSTKQEDGKQGEIREVKGKSVSEETEGDTRERQIQEKLEVVNQRTPFESVRNANTPEAIAREYDRETQDLEGINPKDEFISRIVSRVKKQSFIDNMDKSDITQMVAKSWFSRDGQSLDQLAQEASDISGLDIQPSDIGEFMKKYTSAESIRRPHGNPKLKDLQEKYIALTGKGLNIRTAKKIAAKSTPKPEVRKPVTELEIRRQKTWEEAVAENYTKEEWSNLSYLEKAEYFNNYYQFPEAYSPEEIRIIEENELKENPPTPEQFEEGYNDIDALIDRGEIEDYIEGRIKIDEQVAEEQSKQPSQFEEGKTKIAERPEMENPVYGVLINGEEKFLQRVEGNDFDQWYEVKKSKDGVWDMVEPSLGFNKKEAIEMLYSESKAEQPSQDAENKKIADRIRDKKIRGALSSIDFGLTPNLYNKALDFMANQVEKGTKLGNAIANTIKWIDSQMSGKKWNKGAFGKYMNDTYKVKLADGREVDVTRDDSKETADVINGWYQPIEQAILDTKQESLPANKWAERLRSKEDEDLWTGVREFLESKGTESVSKKELQDYIKENRVEVVEVVKGVDDLTSESKWNKRRSGDGIWETKAIDGTKLIIDASQGDGEVYVYADGKEIDSDSYSDGDNPFDLGIQIIESMTDYQDFPTRFSEYQLEGEKDNYKEVLVTLTSKIKEKHTIKEINGKYYIISPSDESVTSGISERRVAEERAKILDEKLAKSDRFKSSHFDEPNILVHLRMNTRTDSEGNKVLFLEEIQSDWGQKGKKEGFQGDKLNFDYVKTSYGFQLKVDGQQEMVDIHLKSDGDVIVNDDVGVLPDAQMVFDKLEDAKSYIENNFSKDKYTLRRPNKQGIPPSAPFVTDTNSWVKLGLKTAIKEAVNQGATKIAWTTGEQQNSRYDLSKQVDQLEVSNQGEGIGYKVVGLKDGETLMTKFATAQELPDIIGKELSQKIIDSKIPFQKTKIFSGVDLKLGGTGMKGFYDGIVPSVAKATVKELTGKEGVVGETQIDKTESKIRPSDVFVNNKSVKDNVWATSLLDIKNGKSYILSESDLNNINQKLQKDKNNSVYSGRELSNNESLVSSLKIGDEIKIEKQKIQSTQQSIEITPELKASVKLGMPLFGKAESKTKIEQQKELVKQLEKEAWENAKKGGFDNMGISFDFKKAMEADKRFYDSVGRLIREYVRLKGMQASEIYSNLERVLKTKFNPDDRKYLKGIIDEARKEIPKVNVMTENKGLTDYQKGKQGLEEILSAKFKEFKSKLDQQKQKSKSEKDRINSLRESFAQFVKDNRADINQLGTKLNTAILNKVNNIKTELMLDRAIEYTEKILNDQKFRNEIAEKESLIANIKKEADPKNQVKKESGVLKSKRRQTADAIRVMSLIDKAIGMNRIDAETRMQDIQQEIYNGNLTAEEEFNLNAELYALNFSGLENMDNATLKQKLDELKDIKKQDRVVALKELEEYKERVADNVKKTIDVINPNVKEVKAPHLAKKSDFRPDSKMRAFALAHNSFNMVLDKLSKFDKTSSYGKSWLNKWAMNLARKMEQSEQTSRREQLSFVQENYKNIFGENAESTVFANTVPQKFEYTDIDGKKQSIEISQNEAYKRWMEIQDETLSNTLQKMGYGTEYVNALENFMTPETKKWAEWQLKEFYPKYGKELNKTYRDVFGVDMPMNENYSPIYRTQRNVKEDTNLLLSGQNIMNTVNNGSLKARQGSTLPLAYMDGDRVLINYIYQMEFFKSHAKPLKELNGTLFNAEVANNIEQVHGREYLTSLRSFMDEFYRKPEKYIVTDAIVSSFRKNFTVASLALNPVTFIKQLTSIPAYSVFMPARKWAADQSFWTNPVKNGRFLYENSEYLQNRYEAGFDRDMVMSMRSDYKRDLTDGNTFASKMMILTRYGDMAAILVGGWPVYNHYYKEGKSRGMTDQQAKEYGISQFEVATEQAQQAANVKDLSAFQRGGEFYKIMTMYMSSPIQYHNLAMAGLRNMYYGRGTSKENLKMFSMFHIILPAIFAWASMGFRWPDEEEEKYEILRYGAFGNINSVFAVGNFIDYLIKNTIEGKPFEYQTNTVLGGLYGDTKKSVTSVVKLIENENNGIADIADVIDNIARTSSNAVPQLAWYKQVSRTVEGAKDIINEETEFPVKRALGWSDWALGENKNSNRQKNKILEMLYGKDYKKKKKEVEQGRVERYKIDYSKYK